MRRMLVVTLVLVALFVSCADSDAPPLRSPLDDSAAVAGVANLAREPRSAFFAMYPHFKDAATGIDVVLGSPGVAVGRHRVAFVLSDGQGLIREPTVRVASYFRPQGASEARSGPVEEAIAAFFEFPFGGRGIYSTALTFDRAGLWEIEAQLTRNDGVVVATTFAFPVPEQTGAPDVGDPAPHSESRTAGDVGSLAELTSGHEPVAALYEHSIAETLAAGRALVVVFASPAFCTNALCGPQVELLGELSAIYGELADFTHVDLYENPHEIQGDLDRARRTPILEQWGLGTDEWTFIINGEGNVVARFEAYVTRDELEAAIVATLGSD